jgi:hypothetical protein
MGQGRLHEALISSEERNPFPSSPPRLRCEQGWLLRGLALLYSLCWRLCGSAPRYGASQWGDVNIFDRLLRFQRSSSETTPQIVDGVAVLPVQYTDLVFPFPGTPGGCGSGTGQLGAGS